MTTEKYLHEMKDFADLIRVVSCDRGILPQLIETTESCTPCMACSRVSFELKGGTSLSKGYRIIQRFPLEKGDRKAKRAAST